jgi:Prenyltransferase and squalene oxidase repeat
MQRSSAAVALATGALFACLAGSASAEVTDDQARAAAAKGAEWIQSQQTADGGLGGFGGDWAMIGLANADVHAADVRTSAADPSAQDFYVADWSGAFPLEGTSIYRGLLAGHAGGIATAKLSASENLLAKTAGEFDGEQFGAPALVNDDIFALLSIERAGAISSISPRASGFIRKAQAPDGGWSFGASASAGDTDMTGAAIASLCAAGASAGDAHVAAGLDFLESVQNDANGGFDSTFFGSNADSTAWAVDGLRACGIDPQGPRWTTGSGKTPLDFLLALQKASGAFRWAPGNDADNLYSTQNGITALVGDGFGAEPPARVDPADPVVRPAPDVPAGTQVPLTLVLDHDPATPGADRICSFRGAVAAPAAEVLAQAASTAAPSGCVSSLTVDASAGAARVTSVNGVGEQQGSAVWMASLDEAPATASIAGQVQLGSVIALSLSPVAGGPAPEPQQPTPMPQSPQPEPVVAKASLRRRAVLRLGRGGRVRVPVGCPPGVGGCHGTLAVKFRPTGPGGALRTAGRSTFTLGTGERAAVTVRLGRRLRARVDSSRRPQRVRIEAIVRDPVTGTVALTRVLATITKRR